MHVPCWKLRCFLKQETTVIKECIRGAPIGPGPGLSAEKQTIQDPEALRANSFAECTPFHRIKLIYVCIVAV